MQYFIFSKFIPLIFFVFLFLFAGCSSKQPFVEAPVVMVEPEIQEAKIDIEDEVRQAIVASALKYLNTKDGKDCSGFVSLVNFENGEPYYKVSELSNYFSNDYRSKAMYNVMKADARVAKKTTPKIADLVFFSDTLQKTKRTVGAANITHVGIVTKIDKDGTVHFIHHSRGKNIMGAVNAKHPQTAKLKNKNINTYMKQCDPNKPKQECLSPFFLSAYGEIEK